MIDDLILAARALDAATVSTWIAVCAGVLACLEVVSFLHRWFKLWAASRSAAYDDEPRTVRDVPPVLSAPAQSSFQFAPALLTSLGVIGTFLGISVGLYSFEAGADTETMLASVTELIAGMKTAFMTSLVGLLSAAAFMLLLAITNAFRRWGATRARQAFLSSTRDADTEEMLGLLRQLADPDLHRLQQEGTTALTRASHSLGEAAVGLREFSAAEVGREVQKGLEATMLPAFQQMAEEIRRVRVQMEKQDERILKTLLAELREQVIAPLAERVDESAAATRSAAEAVTQLHGDLGQVSLRLAGAAEQMDIFQRQTLSAMEAFNERLVADLTGTFQQIRVDLEASLALQAAEQHRLLSETRAGVVDVLTAAQQTFSEQTATLSATGEEAGAVMMRARDALAETLGGIDETLRSTQNTVETELDRFRVAYQESLDTFFEQQNDLLESTLGAQRDGLHTVVKELDTVFRSEVERQVERQQLADAALDSVRELQESVTAVAGAGMINVREAAAEIGRETLDLGTRYEHLSRVLDATVAGLHNHLQAVDEAYRQQFDQMDAAAARIHDRLLESANYLVLAESERQASA